LTLAQHHSGVTFAPFFLFNSTVDSKIGMPLVVAQDHDEDRILVNFVEKVVGELSKIGPTQPLKSK
jgi:hypothetical protein